MAISKKITTKRLSRDFGCELPVRFSYDGSTRILLREDDMIFLAFDPHLQGRFDDSESVGTFCPYENFSVDS